MGNGSNDFIKSCFFQNIANTVYTASMHTHTKKKSQQFLKVFLPLRERYSTMSKVV